MDLWMDLCALLKLRKPMDGSEGIFWFLRSLAQCLNHMEVKANDLMLGESVSYVQLDVKIF